MRRPTTSLKRACRSALYLRRSNSKNFHLYSRPSSRRFNMMRHPEHHHLPPAQMQRDPNRYVHPANTPGRTVSPFDMSVTLLHMYRFNYRLSPTVCTIRKLTLDSTDVTPRHLPEPPHNPNVKRSVPNTKSISIRIDNVFNTCLFF